MRVVASAECDFLHSALFFAPRRREKMNINYYLAPGSRENWKLAFASGNVWGLRGNRKRTWRRLKKGDVVFFYVQSPISRVLGYGSILATSLAEKPVFGPAGALEWSFAFNLQ